MTAAVVTNDGVWFGLAILIMALIVFGAGFVAETRIERRDGRHGR